MYQSFDQFQKIKTALSTVQQELAACEVNQEKIAKAISELDVAKMDAALALSHAIGVNYQHLRQYMN